MLAIAEAVHTEQTHTHGFALSGRSVLRPDAF
jgi:hypothetical protein